MSNKPAFYRVGNRVINRYEVREVRFIEASGACYPQAEVTYKDGTKVKVTGSRVPMFIDWILDKDTSCRFENRPFGY